VSGKYKVLRIIARLNIGGPAIHASVLTSRLNPVKYDSRLVAGSSGAHEGDLLELRGVEVDSLTRIPELGRELMTRADAVALTKLVKLMRRVRPDIVHTHTAKAGALGRLAAFLTKVPVVIHTFHGHVLRGYFPPLRTQVFVALERALARITTRLVAVSPSVRDDLLGMKIGRPDRFSVIRLGLDLEPFLEAERFRGDLRQELRIPDGHPLVGIVGRLVPVKAHDQFLAAAGRVAAATAAQFVIAGDGELRKPLQARAKEMGLADRIHFLGWRADLRRIYADLDVVVLSSINEGSPVALIEAMASGRPVVATRVGGVADVVSDGVTGLLVSPGDEAALSEAVLNLLADEARRAAMGRAGRASVYPAHSVPRLLNDVDALYTEALVSAGYRL
jgi:glycosyltransferase involved in cell wall biosynthesis